MTFKRRVDTQHGAPTFLPPPHRHCPPAWRFKTTYHTCLAFLAAAPQRYFPPPHACQATVTLLLYSRTALGRFSAAVNGCSRAARHTSI